jgi:eukaryotic-like serine/threonine-protein kinase
MTAFGRYEILDKLGEGAMGVVYRARDATLGRVVAVKMLSAELGQDEEIHQRFRREAEAIGRLSHPNIVSVYDLGQEAGQLYMAMELLEGEDLKTLIEARAPMPIACRVRILVHICAGLAYAHSKGVVHRDIKPANILVTSEGTVKILDFGLARVATRATITRQGIILGTPDYMAPEQASGRPVERRSDIFSAGSVFYELLTFEKPFKGKTLHSVLFKIIQEQPDPLLSLNPDLPTRLAAVVAGMMRKEIDQRYATLDDVGRDLDQIHSALRRSRSRSALPRSDPPAGDDVRTRVRDHLARARGHFDAGRLSKVVPELEETLALDPACEDASALLWRTLRKLQGRRKEPEPPKDAQAEARIEGLLARAAPGKPEAEARVALAELALIAPDDPRLGELLRTRAGRS